MNQFNEIKFKTDSDLRLNELNKPLKPKNRSDKIGNIHREASTLHIVFICEYQMNLSQLNNNIYNYIKSWMHSIKTGSKTNAR